MWVRGVEEVGVLGLRGVGGVVYAVAVRDLTGGSTLLWRTYAVVLGEIEEVVLLRCCWSNMSWSGLEGRKGGAASTEAHSEISGTNWYLIDLIIPVLMHGSLSRTS